MNSDRVMKRIRYNNEQLQVVKQFINNPGTSLFDVQQIHNMNKRNNLVKSYSKVSPQGRQETIHHKIRNSHRDHLKLG